MISENEESFYQSPFSERYASEDMRALFSSQNRYSTFRKLWLELAIAQKKLGLSISASQIEEMKAHLHSIDFAKVQSFEKKFRHDVMAHVYAFGEDCPKAKPIIHLGATSCFVTDNTDLILMREGLTLLQRNLHSFLQKLAKFAQKYAGLPCLGYTHFQPAQPTTIGKRACLWLQDFYLDIIECDELLRRLPFLGSKGATGTQSSFLTLYNGNHEKVKKQDELLGKAFDFSQILTISGQTYPRKWDLIVFHFFDSLAASCQKFAGDIRLLANLGEITEGTGEKQIGSSAMPHKRNPIYSERICGLSRFLLSLGQNPAYTASLQWLERSLDDSSNRRIVIPEAFLCADTLIMLLNHLIDRLSVNESAIALNLEKHLPDLIMENLLMYAALKGKDRQKAHEVLRNLSSEQKGEKSSSNLETLANGFLKKLQVTPNVGEVKRLTSVSSLIGRAPEQTKEYLQVEINPYLKKQKKKSAVSPVLI